ncbi:hypothetical protein JVT61DRAFT_6872 [Boletus reticuloceps]|uniref:Uncharacterized protein n=1 Tax=Boletus reticuloceps TaxID=495285 RepID=A0A8I3A6I7_9AGAM|nr:hypothetical protein JVT61DRAFT_6872 [Boletus reticuloceps]
MTSPSARRRMKRVTKQLARLVRQPKPCRLNNLGYCAVRIIRLGELSDLQDAMSKHRNAVNLTADDRPRKPRG